MHRRNVPFHRVALTAATGGGNKVALSGDVADMDALDALLKSEEGAAAMKHDGVRPDTIAMYIEGPGRLRVTADIRPVEPLQLP